MNALEIVLPMIVVSCKRKKLNKLFERGFEGKASNAEDLKV